MESIAPSSKTATSVIVVAPWEQKAQWKRRGTHRQRQGGRGGERPQEENGRLSDSVKVERETNLLAARQERQMKLFWHHPIHRSTVDRNRVTRATYCPVHVMCVLPPCSSPSDTNGMTGAVGRVRCCKVNKQAPWISAQRHSDFHLMYFSITESS